jgi:hypothetical protein
VFKSRSDDLSEVEALAAKLEPGLAKAILDALTAQGTAVPLDALVAALESGDVGKVVALLDSPEVTAAFAKLTAPLQQAVYAGGALGAGTIATQMRGVSFVFDQLNPRLLTWLQTYNLGLIREISQQTKEGIREYLLAGMTAGRNPKDVAREVKTVIGLTDRQARAVYNFRRELETFHLRTSAGGYKLGGKVDRVNGTQVLRPDEDGLPQDGITERRLRDFRFDGQLQRSMAAGKPLSKEQIDKMVAAYQRKYLAYRSRTIARTEAIRTTNKGVEDSWRQAIEAGKVPEELVRKRWFVTRDERLCKVCGPIPGLNPQRGVTMGAPFNTTKGPMTLPPAHPNCRCSVVFRVWEPEQLKG